MQAKLRSTQLAPMRVGQCAHINVSHAKNVVLTTKTAPSQRRQQSSVACSSTGDGKDVVAALPWQMAMSEVKKRRDIKTIMIIGASVCA